MRKISVSDLEHIATLLNNQNSATEAEMVTGDEIFQDLLKVDDKLVKTDEPGLIDYINDKIIHRELSLKNSFEG